MSSVEATFPDYKKTYGDSLTGKAGRHIRTTVDFSFWICLLLSDSVWFCLILSDSVWFFLILSDSDIQGLRTLLLPTARWWRAGGAARPPIARILRAGGATRPPIARMLRAGGAPRPTTARILRAPRPPTQRRKRNLLSSLNINKSCTKMTLLEVAAFL